MRTDIGVEKIHWAFATKRHHWLSQPLAGLGKPLRNGMQTCSRDGTPKTISASSMGPLTL